jgi:hypothetical protein
MSETPTRHVMVRYKVKPGRVEENEALVRAVYEELARTQPDGLQYTTVKLDDGVTFVHIAANAEPSPLPEVAAFRALQQGIAERCDEPPVVTPIEVVGSFRLFDA